MARVQRTASPPLGLHHGRKPDTGGREVLDAWMARGFEVNACRRWLEEKIASSPHLEELFDTAAVAVDATTLVARDCLLYPEEGTWVLSGLGSKCGSLAAPTADVLELADIVRAFAEPEEANREIFEDNGWDWPETVEPFVLPKTPGIYRLWHSEVAIFTGESFLLTDPVNFSWSRRLASNCISTVLVSHLHGDHWHPASLLALDPPGGVIVPAVPRATTLTDIIPADDLAALGLKGIASAWGSVLEVDGARVEVMPFFGEQPAREEPWHDMDNIRNWGNCYRVDTEGMSVLLLCDSGGDPTGTIVPWVERSVAQHGPIDCVLSCLRSFPAPFFEGLIYDWLPFRFGQLARLFHLYITGALPPSTGGLELVAEVCAAAKASFFLPYANGFSGFHRPIGDIGWYLGEGAEKNALDALEACFTARKLDTQIVAWNCGDAFHPWSQMSPWVPRAA